MNPSKYFLWTSYISKLVSDQCPNYGETRSLNCAIQWSAALLKILVQVNYVVVYALMFSTFKIIVTAVPEIVVCCEYFQRFWNILVDREAKNLTTVSLGLLQIFRKIRKLVFYWIFFVRCLFKLSEVSSCRMLKFLLRKLLETWSK